MAARRKTHRELVPGAVEVVFCGETEADNFILLEVRRLLAAGAKTVIVATSDLEMAHSVGSGVRFCEWILTVLLKSSACFIFLTLLRLAAVNMGIEEGWVLGLGGGVGEQCTYAP